MKQINTKDNIWVCGFEKFVYLNNISDKNMSINSILYKGNMRDVTEEMASNWVKHRNFYEFKNYKEKFTAFKTAIESLKSACQFPYIIVYKK